MTAKRMTATRTDRLRRGRRASGTDPIDERPPVVVERQAPLAPMVAVAALAYTLAAVGVVSVLALILFYVFEVTSPNGHVFGPISDITGSAWNLLLLPLIIGVGTTVLPITSGRLIYHVTVAMTAASGVGSALLVVRVLPFEVATVVSVTALMVQAVWLFTVGLGLRRFPGWSPMGRSGQLIGIGTWVGAVLVAVSLLFGWGSAAQLGVMIAGLVPGLLAWFGWPGWAFFLARRLSTLSISTHQKGI